MTLGGIGEVDIAVAEFAYLTANVGQTASGALTMLTRELLESIVFASSFSISMTWRGLVEKVLA